MSDYLSNVLARVDESAPIVQPRRPSLFERAVQPASIDREYVEAFVDLPMVAATSPILGAEPPVAKEATAVPRTPTIAESLTLAPTTKSTPPAVQEIIRERTLHSETRVDSDDSRIDELARRLSGLANSPPLAPTPEAAPPAVRDVIRERTLHSETRVGSDDRRFDELARRLRGMAERPEQQSSPFSRVDVPAPSVSVVPGPIPHPVSQAAVETNRSKAGEILAAMVRPAADVEAPTKNVRVNIGRIEIKRGANRASAPASVTPVRRESGGVMTLQDYLKRRSGRGPS